MNKQDPKPKPEDEDEVDIPWDDDDDWIDGDDLRTSNGPHNGWGAGFAYTPGDPFW